MKRIGRIGVVMAVAAGLLGLAACDRPGTGADPAAADVSEMSWDEQAMESLGIRADELPGGNAVAAEPAPTAASAVQAAAVPVPQRAARRGGGPDR